MSRTGEVKAPPYGSEEPIHSGIRRYSQNERAEKTAGTTQGATRGGRMPAYPRDRKKE